MFASVVSGTVLEFFVPAVRDVGTWGPPLPTWSFRSSEERAGEPCPGFVLGRNLQSAPVAAEPEAGPKPRGGAVLHGAGSEPCWSHHPTVVQAQALAQAARGKQKWQVHTDQYPDRANWGGGRLIYSGRLLGQAWCKCVIGFVGLLVAGCIPPLCRQQDPGSTGYTDPQN